MADTRRLGGLRGRDLAVALSVAGLASVAAVQGLVLEIVLGAAVAGRRAAAVEVAVGAGAGARHAADGGSADVDFGDFGGEDGARGRGGCLGG